MSLLYVVRAVVRNPNFPIAIFPNKDFQRQVDGNTRSSQHKRCASLWTSKNQQFGRKHTHSNLFRLVDQRKKSDSLRLQNILEPLHGLLYRVIAQLVDDSVICCRCHIGCLLSAFEIRVPITLYDRSIIFLHFTWHQMRPFCDLARSGFSDNSDLSTTLASGSMATPISPSSIRISYSCTFHLLKFLLVPATISSNEVYIHNEYTHDLVPRELTMIYLCQNPLLFPELLYQH